MEMRYFWILDLTTHHYIKVYYNTYQLEAENMGDYSSKAHTIHIHKYVRPYYIQKSTSPRKLSLIARPSTWQGCVETLVEPYYKRVPLPHISDIRDLIRDSKLMKPTVEVACVERNIIGNYLNGCNNMFGRRHASTKQSVQYQSLYA